MPAGVETREACRGLPPTNAAVTPRGCSANHQGLSLYGAPETLKLAACWESHCPSAHITRCTHIPSRWIKSISKVLGLH